MEKTHSFAISIINNASITQNARFLYTVNGFILGTSYVYGKFDHFSTWKCHL